MSGSQVTITLEDAALKRALQDLQRTLASPDRAMRDIGEFMLRSTDQRFRAQVGPDGTPWEQLSEVTLLRRLTGTAKDPRKGNLSKKQTATGGRTLTKKGMKVLANAKILRDSGMLQDTIAYQLADGGRAVEIGTNRVYGAMQQFGGTKAQWPHLWGDIPARPFLGVSEADQDGILRILRRHLARDGVVK